MCCPPMRLVRDTASPVDRLELWNRLLEPETQRYALEYERAHKNRESVVGDLEKLIGDAEELVVA